MRKFRVSKCTFCFNAIADERDEGHDSECIFGDGSGDPADTYHEWGIGRADEEDGEDDGEEAKVA